MNNYKNETKKIVFTAIPFIILSLILVTITVTALPSQPLLTYVTNETSASSGVGQARDGDKGGYITTINLYASQQNFAWKAYVGNVTGKLVLENSGQFSIFEWDMGLDALGNVYISRNGTVSWSGINCSNQTEKENEDSFLGLDSTSSNSINTTFNDTIHKSFTISGVDYSNSSCYAISTYINDTVQPKNEGAKFQEVLLADSQSNIVYMVMMEQNQVGYDNTSYDFQAIVAEDEAASTPTRYFFYVELSG